MSTFFGAPSGFAAFIRKSSGGLRPMARTLSRNALVPKTLSPFRFFGDLDLKVAGRPMALSAIETPDRLSGW